MKRCNVCGNIGDDECTVCSICGNPLTEADVITEQEEEPVSGQAVEPEPDLMVTSEEVGVATASAMKAEASAKTEASAKAEVSAKVAASMPETAPPNEAVASAEKSGADKREPSAQQSDEAVPSAQQPDGTASSVNRPVRVRRSRSGPQIYGQDSMSGYSGAQGVIRRDVQGGHMSDGTQSVSGAASSVNRTAGDAGASRRAERRDNISAQNRSAETGKVRSFRSESAADMRQDRSANGQLNTPGGAANAQSGAPVNRPMQGQRPGVPPYVQVAQGDRQQAIKITTARKVMETARDALASPMIILIALFYTVYFVSNIAAIFLRQLNFSQIARLLTMFSFPSQLSGYISMFQAAMSWLDKGALALNLLIRVPELLFCIGLWLLIVLVRTADEQMSGVGFLLMRISVILTMIVACGILLVVLVVSVTLVIAAWSAGTQSVIVVAAVTLAAAIAVTMAVLMYYFCYLATLKTVRRSAGNGGQYGKASAYVAVIHIIIAFTGIINILSGIVNLEITGITGGAGQICWMVLFGIWILRYRSSMNEYAE